MERDAFAFITPKALRYNIIESVKFAGFLWMLAQSIDDEFKDETVRTIILYNVSVIEALLLFRTRRENIVHEDVQYRHLQVLPSEFKKQKQDLIIAYRSSKKKQESRIWLQDMIKKQEKFLGSKLTKEIAELQGIRNTLHLSKARGELFLPKAESSFAAMLELVNKLRASYVKVE